MQGIVKIIEKGITIYKKHYYNSKDKAKFIKDLQKKYDFIDSDELTLVVADMVYTTEVPEPEPLFTRHIDLSEHEKLLLKYSD